MTSKTLIFVLLVQLTFLHTYGQQSKKYFRKDYTFLSAPSSFYKVHTLHRTWVEAKRKCATEGATLFYAEDATEADAVITHWNETQPGFYWVYVGVSALLVKEVFETIDGRPVLDVYSNWGPGEPNDANGVEDCVMLRRDGTLNDVSCDQKYPFICKKTLDSLEWNQDCDMPNTDYVYDKSQGRCYKFHLNPKTWSEAVALCSAELSYLAVPNSQSEAEFLVKLTAQAQKSKVTGNFANGVVHLGFHNRDGEGWKTIKGASLEEGGYANWAGQQPDGGDNEQCGSMFFDGQLNDISCQARSFFICEHDIPRLSNEFDERLGNS